MSDCPKACYDAIILAPLAVLLVFRQTVFRLFSLCFGLAGLYHLVGFMFPDWVAPAPPWRHALFVGINTCGCWLMLTHPAWLIWPFTLLTLQQIYSHANRAMDWWVNQSRIDWLSLGVLVVLPLAWHFLWQERQEKSTHTVARPPDPT